jgi:uncharacterized membrane protein
MERAEQLISHSAEWIRLIIESFGVLVIAAGVLMTFVKLARAARTKREGIFTDVRLDLARYLVLALELQLAADVISTAIAPTWDDIGKLGAIVVIRTVLNYFLMREMQQEEAASRRQDGGSPV